MKRLEELMLSTLSFFEPMSFSKIVFDMDPNALKEFPDFDKNQMMSVLTALEKRGLVKKTGPAQDPQWQRVHKKRPFWKRFF